MAKIESLLGRIKDTELKAQLEKEVSALKRRMRFGLVYERHLPETVILRETDDLKVGDHVRPRERINVDEDFRVVQLDSRKAKVVSIKTGQEISVKFPDLRIVKRFGDPAFTGLELIGSVVRNEERPFHAVIDGENYHALQTLSYSLKGKVDCIYIDPPFNTGARDWKYNNHYVDEKDAYRHSKWLSFMEKRLRLAKPLLKEDGVLVVMVDEHELYHLGMLLEEFFPKHLRYMVSIVINSNGSTGNRNFGIVEEQAMFVVPDVGYDLIEARELFISSYISEGRQADAEDLLIKIVDAIPNLEEQLSQLANAPDEDEMKLLRKLAKNAEKRLAKEDKKAGNRRPGEYWRTAVRTGQATSPRTQRPKQFYPIFVDPKAQAIVSVGRPLLERNEDGRLSAPSWEVRDGLVPVWPLDEEGQEKSWCYEPDRMQREIEAGNIRLGAFNPKRNTYAINVGRIRQRLREINVWWEQSYDAGANGTNMLTNLLGESGTFPFPKSVYAVRDVLATVVGGRPDALILDFFAGSGTTFHATCLLNAEDGGSRRSILVTNNEVESKEAKRLAKQGVFPGDPEYERHGLFEKVTAPRVKAVVEGRRPDGTPIPGSHKWAGGRPFAEGFLENVEFFRLNYLNSDNIELGKSFDSIHPLLWLAAGARGPRPVGIDEAQSFVVASECGYAVLLKEEAFLDFEGELEGQEGIDCIFFITDSEEAYAEMCTRIGQGRRTSMLYRDYLTSLRRRPR